MAVGNSDGPLPVLKLKKEDAFESNPCLEHNIKNKHKFVFYTYFVSYFYTSVMPKKKYIKNIFFFKQKQKNKTQNKESNPGVQR